MKQARNKHDGGNAAGGGGGAGAGGAGSGGKQNQQQQHGGKINNARSNKNNKKGHNNQHDLIVTIDLVMAPPSFIKWQGAGGGGVDKDPDKILIRSLMRSELKLGAVVEIL